MRHVFFGRRGDIHVVAIGLVDGFVVVVVVVVVVLVMMGPLSPVRSHSLLVVVGSCIRFSSRTRRKGHK